MNSGRINIWWLSKFFTLAFILNAFGIGQSHALYSPVYDYPMTIIEATSLGDGWYAGRGKTRLKTIIDAPVALRFDRLRINVDNFQIDGTVEASYDEQKGKIGNLDYIDDGGKDIQPSTLRIQEHYMGITIERILYEKGY